MQNKATGMLTEERKIKVFIDFDGTITLKDVGASMFLNFGDMEKIGPVVNRIDAGEISGSEGWKELFKLLPAVPKKELDDFIETMEIDPSFHEFVQYLRENKIEFYVLSDGFDYYIERIFEKEKIKGIKYFSNKLFYSDNADMKTDYPYRDEECRDCANCKRNHLLMYSGDDEYTIYVGNGSSDRCPAQYCDFIFAKETLLKFCEKEKIPYSQFETFSDVRRKMTEMLLRKRLKRRHQAGLKRRSVYLLG
ncbi:MAG TPA: MtnX-like HAD-IB family phosphatase [Ignavibacteriaceae bacterium]|nr:MtnX-like HAD-IB family phosphatase [Ignavibacteriaceae bacterium]